MMRNYLLTATLILTCVAAPASERTSLDNGWRFTQGDPSGAEAVDYAPTNWAPTNWQSVDLPHDWSRIAAPTANAPSEGHGGFHHTGIGWYRRALDINAQAGEQYRLEFGGVYQKATVWLNGQKLGEHHYGYTPFQFDLTPHLRQTGPNVLAVRVDNSDQPNCRWYSGSGIYRHVWLRKLPPVHIVPESVWVENSPHAYTDFTLHYAVKNLTQQPQSVSAVAAFDATDLRPASNESTQLQLAAGETKQVDLKLGWNPSKPWSAEDPQLQHLTLRLLPPAETTSSESLDQLSHTFGLRSIAWDAKQGLRINGKTVKLYGGCVHHDNGPLGAMAFDMAEERRVLCLKAAGFNALRTSHNPPSEAFLDACDRLGMYVIDECFDNWAKQKVSADYGPQFEQLWRQELQAMVERDRRHPCILMWSTGNELYERGEPSGIRYSQALAEFTKQLDPSRPTTIALCGLGKAEHWPRLDPVFAPVDIAGYNYETARYAEDHPRHPGRVMYGSESYPAEAFESWQAVDSQPWVIGDFVWTAMDYLGEAAIGRVFPPGETPRKHWEGSHFPWRGAACGDIDLIGHRKPVSYLRSIVWNCEQEQPLYAAVVPPAEGPWGVTPWAPEPLAAHWNWQAGQELRVRAFSRRSPVKLFLNGELVDEQPTTQAQKFQAEFRVAFEPGELRVVDADGNEFALHTAGQAACIALDAEHASAPANRQSLLFLNASLQDAQQRLQPTQDRTVSFQVEGPAELLAVGNADLTATQSYAAHSFDTYEGRVQAILRSTGQPGDVTVTATSPGLAPAVTTVQFSPRSKP